MFFKKKVTVKINEQLVNEAVKVFEEDEQDFRAEFKSIDFVYLCQRLQRIPDLDSSPFGWTLNHYLDSSERKHVLYIRCTFNNFDEAFSLYRKIVSKVIKPVNYKVD